MNEQERVQVFKEYSIEFATNIPTIDEELARHLISFLYRDSKIIEKEDDDYKIETIPFSENITKSTGIDKYSYALKMGCFRNEGKYIVAGLVVSSAGTTSGRIPYFFICAGQKLSFWKADIANYEGDFVVTEDSFMIENKLGIKKESNSISLHVPRKSAFLLGKYQDCIKDQVRIKYEATSLNNNLYIFKGVQESVGQKSKQTQVRNVRKRIIKK